MIRIILLFLMFLNTPAGCYKYCIDIYETLQAHESDEGQRQEYSDKITEIKKHLFEMAWKRVMKK